MAVFNWMLFFFVPGRLLASTFLVYLLGNPLEAYSFVIVLELQQGSRETSPFCLIVCSTLTINETF